MKTYPIDKIKLATAVARNDSRRWPKQHCWVLHGYQKRVDTQKGVGDSVLLVGFNYELPAYFKDILDCYFKGKKVNP